MQGVLQQAISLVSAPLSQVARLAAALEQAAQEDPSIIAGAGTPAPVDQEQSTEETAAPVAAEAAPAAEDTDAAPAVEDSAEAAPAAEDSSETAPAVAEDTTTVAADAADEN